MALASAAHGENISESAIVAKNGSARKSGEIIINGVAYAAASAWRRLSAWLSKAANSENEENQQCGVISIIFWRARSKMADGAIGGGGGGGREAAYAYRAETGIMRRRRNPAAGRRRRCNDRKDRRATKRAIAYKWPYRALCGICSPARRCR